ncbi:nucleoside phosphatase family-domain-containing protein [Radiomyces spectabilis]|uniref:nucleoside phosphatase family-domain-containing protein n=1 Tax=Radiomyces spectabilis TaxID=64574 RepID=UPI002220D6CC|nr:nucleoside phosphatase family-domain-containing protein [Radiomyces spectabilis]KAI8388326.1 nucleoside phosphatase family-domain-containing protein [Radiomyces spectabilis]
MLVKSLLVLAATLGAVAAHPLEKRQQPDAVETPDLDLQPLHWGDVNFIQTTDTHGWLQGHVLQPQYNGDLGDFYSFVVRMKEKARKMKKDLFVVDCGDTHDGNGLSDTTQPKGKETQPLLKKIPYDILSIGNHELYVNNVTIDVVNNYIDHWKGRYLAANVYFKDLHTNKTVPIADKYTYFKGKYGTRVLALGFLFNFHGNDDLSVVKPIVEEVKEPWFKKAMTSHKPDIIVLFGHVGLRFQEMQDALAAVRQYYPYLPVAIMGGHTHIRDFAVYDRWAAGVQGGRYLESVAWMSLDGVKESTKYVKKHGYNGPTPSSNITFHRRYLDQNRKTYIFHTTKTAKKFDTKEGKSISKRVTKLRHKLDLAEPYGCAPQDYYVTAAPVNSTDSIYDLVTNGIMAHTVVDSSRKNPAFYLINTGGIRYDVYKGPFTLDNMYQVSPFGDNFYYLADVPHSAAKQMLDIINEQGELKKRDNTHIPNPYFKAPVFAGSRLPENATDDTLIDVVFVEFMNKQMELVAYSLTNKNFTAQLYGSKERGPQTPYTALRNTAKQSAKTKQSTTGVRLSLAALGLLLAIIVYIIPDSKLFSLFHSPSSNSVSCSKYALMIDAGSTGSRIHVYRFHQCAAGDHIELEDEELFEQTIPGLSAYADSPQKAAESLDVLLQAAVKVVPQVLQRKTPIAVKATAGLRLLGDEKSDNILQAVNAHLKKRYPFPIADDGVSIMDGRDEGVYAWVTVNFLLGKLRATSETRPSTAAVFDLGGGSTQIVFEPDTLESGELLDMPEGDHKYVLTYGKRDYLLYQHSYLGYGLMEARKRMHKKIIQVGQNASVMINPCLPPEFSWPFEKYQQPEDPSVSFTAGGSYSDCTSIVDDLLNKEAMCLAPPCSFDGIHQPPISEAFREGPIYIFSYFYDRTQPLGLPANFRLPELAKLTDKVCSGEFLAGVKDPALKAEMLDRPEWCLDLSYIYGLLAHGYEIPDDRMISIAKKINGVETGWCLGAAIAMLDENSLHE